MTKTHNNRFAHDILSLRYEPGQAAAQSERYMLQ